MAWRKRYCLLLAVNQFIFVSRDHLLHSTQLCTALLCRLCTLHALDRTPSPGGFCQKAHATKSYNMHAHDDGRSQTLAQISSCDADLCACHILLVSRCASIVGRRKAALSIIPAEMSSVLVLMALVWDKELLLVMLQKTLQNTMGLKENVWSLVINLGFHGRHYCPWPCRSLGHFFLRVPSQPISRCACGLVSSAQSDL